MRDWNLHSITHLDVPDLLDIMGLHGGGQPPLPDPIRHGMEDSGTEMLSLQVGCAMAAVAEICTITAVVLISMMIHANLNEIGLWDVVSRGMSVM